MAPHHGHTVDQGGLGLMVPGRRLHRKHPLVTQRSGQPGDERAPSQPHWRGAGHGEGRPRAWGLQPELGAGLLTRHLDRPAPHDPWKDSSGRGLKVGTDECLHPQLPRRVGPQHLANRHRRQARRVPQSGAGETPERWALRRGPSPPPRSPLAHQRARPRPASSVGVSLSRVCDRACLGAEVRADDRGPPPSAGARPWSHGVGYTPAPATPRHSPPRRPRPAGGQAASGVPGSSSAAPHPPWL